MLILVGVVALASGGLLVAVEQNKVELADGWVLLVAGTFLTTAYLTLNGVLTALGL
jgi:hypothetical protein